MNEIIILYLITIVAMFFGCWKLGTIEAQLEIIKNELEELKK
jgi:hypothetical protein